MTFGERVKNLRKARNWTQDELAERSGMGLGQISKIERGDNRDPKLSTIEKIMNGLNVSADKLIPGERAKGLTGMLERKLEVLSELSGEDIKTVVRVIDNFAVAENVRNALMIDETTPEEEYENNRLQEALDCLD